MTRGVILVVRFSRTKDGFYEGLSTGRSGSDDNRWSRDWRKPLAYVNGPCDREEFLGGTSQNKQTKQKNGLTEDKRVTHVNTNLVQKIVKDYNPSVMSQYFLTLEVDLKVSKKKVLCNEIVLG